jgi:hypothetical protein
MKEIREIRIEKTKKGFPALWERGGGYTNTGDAVIIANGDGTAKRPVYIRRRGSLACDNHALFVVKPGDIVVEANHHRRDFEIRIWRIDQILEEEARLNLLHEFSLGEWSDKNIERVFSAWEAGDLRSIDDIDDEIYFLCRAILAAEEKATCYHCGEPHYIKEE